jgi:uncharacterized protein (TIGR02118 family)
MIVRMGWLTRKQGLSRTQFAEHWQRGHGPIAARFPGLKRYEQNVVTDDSQLGIKHARGAWSIDGISQLWFDDLATMNAAIGAPGYAPALSDETAFIGNISLVSCETQVVKAPDESTPLIKRMSILTRRADLTSADFKREWWGSHAGMVAKFPNLAGYKQNLVVARGRTPGATPTADENSIDGVVELWFRSVADLQTAFASPAAVVSQTHARDFISEITTFLVNPRRVI